jgi:(R,R)-butanediol dehydrogenase / meso-butanediol dehydrogenase / diacetyl reductase
MMIMAPDTTVPEMHAALITGKGVVELREFPEPDPTPTGVVVAVRYCGICGTDVHAYQSGNPYNPAVCGHEWTGTVAKLGSEVSHVDEGDRVVIAVPSACGRCAACTAGQATKCQTVLMATTAMGPYGGPHGGFAPMIGVEAGRVVRGDSRLSDQQLAQVEPATICFHAVRANQPRLGEVAVIQGAGPIGLNTLQWVLAAGAATTIVVEPSEQRRATAVAVGATMAVAPGEEADTAVKGLTGGLGADVVYECAGIPSTVQSAVDLARRGGRMALIGLAVGDAPISPRTWLIKEIQVTAALGYSHEEFAMVMGYIADGRVDVDALLSNTVPLDGLEAALADLASGQSSEVKVLVDPNASR